MEDSLTEIGTRYNCDKFTCHNFGDYYERHIGAFRHEPIKLLEIGIGGEDFQIGGESLRTWEEYFTQAEIIGIDIFPKEELRTSRIATHVCDQGDRKSLCELADSYGQFDVIIDDGSHKSNDTLMSFFSLVKYVVDGGYYIIEDIQTSYWPHYGGSSVCGDFKETTIAWIKKVVDVVNSCEILWPDHPGKRFGYNVSELHVYRNICFLRISKTPGTSNVLNDENSVAWLQDDFNKHSLNEETACLLNNNPSFNENLMRFVHFIKSFK